MIWTLNDKDIDFSDLQPDQLCNHFEGIFHLATKQGFCELVREAALVGANGFSLSPRAYNLGDPIHRDEFIDDFRITAAVGILKLYLCDRHAEILHTSSRIQHFLTLSKETKRILHLAIWAVNWYLRVQIYGEWPGVDISKHFRDRETCLEDDEWYDVVNLSYELSMVDQINAFAVQKQILGVSKLPLAERRLLHAGYHPIDHKIRSLLKLYFKHQPQCLVEGYRNIWVAKSPDSSCGKGIKLFSRLEDILDMERRMKGRTVQKYIESPLLDSNGGVKFDLRVWVLVTSVQPLQAHIYRRIYGRRCIEAFTANVDTLDPAIHLTNYSVQKKLARKRPNTGAMDDDEEPSLREESAPDLLFRE